MQRCYVTKETTFTINFSDSEDARVFYNRAHDPFSYLGSLDWDRGEITAIFEKPEDIEKFVLFLKDNLEEIGITEKSQKIYRLYKLSIPETGGE